MGDLADIDLSGVEAKLRRADEHAEAFTGAIAAFTHLHAHGISLEPNHDLSQYIIRVHFGTEPDFARWGVLLGDYVHCLRAALDHLIYAVAVAESESDPPPGETKLMMPVKSTPQGFGRAAHRIASLSRMVRTRIESLQPYGDRPQNQLLGILEQLDIRDKHRILSVVLIQPVNASFRISGHPPGSTLLEVSVKPLEDGAPLVTMTFARPAPDVKVEGYPAFLVVVPDFARSSKGSYDIGNLVLLLRLEVRRAIGVILGRDSVTSPVPMTPILLTGHSMDIAEEL